ncbi:HD domain-containing protein, partial [bacterium]|nr:HD domain-containing protein [bacterium]
MTAASDPNTNTITVRSHDQCAGKPTRLYAPLARETLLSGQAAPVDIYARVSHESLRLMFPANTAITEEARDEIQRSDLGDCLYVRLEERGRLIEHQLKILPGVLADQSIPIDAKCHLIQTVTSSLSRKVLDDPTAPNIRRYRHSISQMVDLTLSQPAALRGLLGLTHHDYYTYTHSVNVGMYAFALAMQHFGKHSQHDLREVAVGFFLHDIGKCRVAPEIINKNGPLSDTEWTEIRRHPDHGLDLLRKEKELTEQTEIVVGQHHERPNGTGYPGGLRGGAIHTYARICCIADVFDALTTRR